MILLTAFHVIESHQYIALALLLLGLSWLTNYFFENHNSYQYYRLPTSLRPEYYNLKVITQLEDPYNLIFDGQVSIRFKVLQNTINITLHSQNLNIHESRTKLKNYNDNKMGCLLTTTSVPDQDYYIIQLCKMLHKGEEYELELYFSGKLNENLHGYYRSLHVVKETNEIRWLSVTQFEPAYARTAFPCFDEPEYKAKFIIWLGHHKSLTALSNMPLQEQIPIADLNDYVWSIFEESVPMSTYLVAYTVNDFVYKKSEPNLESNNKIEFRTWARPDAIDQCDYASVIGPKLLKYYEDIFGIQFPLKKVDEIAIADFEAGAMENWGLITYRESALFFSPNVSSKFNKMHIAQIIAHELAHQWFGNLVTMKWWSDLWLKEGFATYVATLGVQYINPEWEFYNYESFANSLDILRKDAQLSSHPISQPILNTNQITEIFDSISYEKGSAVLRMLHLVLENDAFFEGIQKYLNKYKYSNAEQNDLWTVLTEVAHSYNRIDQEYDMKTIMDSWTLQTGYPLVKVIRDYKTGSVEISQHRFFENEVLTAIQTEKEQCWWVPLSYTTASKNNFQSTTPQNWFECEESGESKILYLDNVANENEWVIFNIQMSGIYRVMYDLNNWNMLKETLNSKEFTNIHVMNRAQIIDDVLMLAWSGYYDYDITFDILRYLIQEREYLPWKAALEGLSSVNRLLRPFTANYKLFKRFLLHIIKPIYYYLGGISKLRFEKSESFTKNLHKSLIVSWACQLGMNNCVKNSIKYFNDWKASTNPNIENKIPADLKPIVYCTAIRHGNEGDWGFLWQRYKESNMAAERRTIITSLSCSRDKLILSNYINMTYNKNGQIRDQDVTYAFGSIAYSEIGFAIAKEYFMKNIDKLNDYYGHSNGLGYLLPPLASQITSLEDLNQLADIIESRREIFKLSENKVKSAFETININIVWVDRNIWNTNSSLQLRLDLTQFIEPDKTVTTRINMFRK